MEDIKIWIYSLCGAMFITSVFKLIVSGSKLEKSVNIFLSVFIFLYAVFPVNNVKFDFDPNFDIDESNTEAIYQNGYESIIKESIEKICTDNNIDIISINIESYLDKNGDFIVNNIFIECEDSDNKDNIQSILHKELGFEVEVI